MDRNLEQQILEVEERHWWYQGRRRIVGEVVRALELPSSAEILDAGCGSGRNMVDLAPLGAVTGVEIAQASAEHARARGVGEVVEASLTELPFAADSFDLAVCLDVIEHIEEDRVALSELRRVVRPTGALLVTVPAYQWLWSEHDLINHHVRRYTRRTLDEVAASAGWTTVWTTYFNSWLLPVAAVHRRLSRLRQSFDEPVSDLQLTPERMNSVLEQPLRFEAWLIARGRRLPAGLSLMAVFREGSGPGAASAPGWRPGRRSGSRT